MNSFPPIGFSLTAPTENRAALRAKLVVGILIGLFTVGRTAFGQTDVVFMTADVSIFGPTKLVRFDAGVETFAVDQSGSHAFHGITVLKGELLVADFLSNKIHRFLPDGTNVGDFASPGFSPTYLETDHGGNVYATPIGPPFEQPIARRFDSAGVVTQTFNHADMEWLAGIDADAAGSVYVADDASELYKFAADGTFLNRISLGSVRPGDLTIDEVGNLLYLADQKSETIGIKIFDISAEVPNLIGSIETPPDSEMYGIHFAAESGNIFAIESGLDSLDPRGLEFSPAGVLLREFRPANVETALDITTFVVEAPPEPADYNRNGIWDSADYVLWRRGDPAADGTGDGIVDEDDYQFWRQRFGQSAGIGAGASIVFEPSAAVPEPSTALLIGFGTLAALVTGGRFARTRCPVTAAAASFAAAPLVVSLPASCARLLHHNESSPTTYD